jgi:hypothetical protein
MRLGNSIRDYDEMDQQIMVNQIKAWYDTLEETDTLLTKEITEKNPPKEGDNVVHLDMNPFTEFEALQNAVLDLQDLLNVYDRWNDRLWELAILNVGQYKNKKVVEYMCKLRFQVGTFYEFFNAPSPGRASS